MSEADDIMQALLAGTLGIAQHGLAEVDVEPEPDAPPPRQQHERHGFRWAPADDHLLQRAFQQFGGALEPTITLGPMRELVMRGLAEEVDGQFVVPSYSAREYTIPPTVRVDNAYLLTPDGVRIDCTCLDEAHADQDGPINLVWDVSVGEHVGQHGLIRSDGAWCPRRMILRSRRNPEGESS